MEDYNLTEYSPLALVTILNKKSFGNACINMEADT